jgi:hypothetical protein
MIMATTTTLGGCELGRGEFDATLLVVTTMPLSFLLSHLGWLRADSSEELVGLRQLWSA